MIKVELYNGIKQDLEGLTYVKGNGQTGRIHRVSLWRNNLANEKDEIADKLPSAYIEFTPSQYMEGSSKVYQTVDMSVKIHVLFESKKTEDLDILYLMDAIFSQMQLKQYGAFGVMKRRSEDQNFDHDNVQDYIQEYLVSQGKDYGSDRRPTGEAQVDDLNINFEYDK
jgi:hypothetical protein